MVTQPTENVECIKDKTHDIFASFNRLLNSNRSLATNLKVMFNYMIDANLIGYTLHWYRALDAGSSSPVLGN